ncbi:MAG: hypothetical protein JNJ59_07580 [Deltaproteobacteria bacterium]|nr:hypothetical protein [Deltaproteobacteria bacterium]
MSELVIIACETGAASCGAAAPPARDAAVRDVVDSAIARLAASGFETPAPVIVLDASLGGPIATTLIGASDPWPPAAPLPPSLAGRTAIFFQAGLGAETRPDVLLHELTHVWLRSHGADDPRWRLDAGRATHESAVVHEGIADFVAASLSNSPTLYAGLGTATRSLAPTVRCPDDLSGAANDDAAIVSSALWELGGAGRSPDAMAEVLAAVRQSARDASRGFDAFVSAIEHALEAHPTRATHWNAIVQDRGLRMCHAPITLRESRTSSRGRDFVAAGTQRFAAALTRPPDASSPATALSEVTGPLQFRATVEDVRTLQIGGRSSERDALAIDWQSRDIDGRVLTRGRADFEGWPSPFATLILPPQSHTLTFAFVNSRAHDVTYNDLRVTALESHPSPTHALGAPESRTGCSLGGSVDLVLPLLIAGVLHRTRHAARRAAPHERPTHQR